MRKIKLHPIYIFPVILVLGLLVMVLSADAQTPPAQTTVYLPIILNGDPIPSLPYHKGIAMVQPQYQEDLTNVGADWYYVWSVYPEIPTNSKNIPMSRCGLFDTATFPTDYSGYVLIFNEPVNREPNGCGITPQLAAERYMLFMDAYSSVIPIVGNNGANGAPWNMDFIDALQAANYPVPEVWGVHLYYEPYYTFDRWKNDIGALMHFFERAGIPQPEIWVTEFSMTSGDPVIFKQMLEYISTLDYVTHVAPFTNRAMYDEPWWPENWSVELFNDDGSYTPMGEVYRDWH